jgi:hypothetical protein
MVSTSTQQNLCATATPVQVIVAESEQGRGTPLLHYSKIIIRRSFFLLSYKDTSSINL